MEKQQKKGERRSPRVSTSCPMRVKDGKGGASPHRVQSACSWAEEGLNLHQWNSPGNSTEVGSHALLQGIFLTQGSNLCLLCLLHWPTQLKIFTIYLS